VSSMAQRSTQRFARLALISSGIKQLLKSIRRSLEFRFEKASLLKKRGFFLVHCHRGGGPLGCFSEVSKRLTNWMSQVRSPLPSARLSCPTPTFQRPLADMGSK
jgi:hypothetical protein